MNEVTKHFWENTYRQSIAKMIGVSYRYTCDRQTAEDLAHDAFLIAIDKSASFENRGPFEAWLRRIVINVTLQYVREQKKQIIHQGKVAYETSSIESPEDSYSHPENTFSEAELLKAIRLLPEHHRLVFNLYVFDEFTHAQIGAQLEISEGTSKSHLARARKKIREMLTKKAKQNPKRKRLILLFLFPDRLGLINQLFYRQLNAIKIQPKNRLSVHTLRIENSSIPINKPSPFVPQTLIKNDLASVAIALNIVIATFSILVKIT